MSIASRTAPATSQLPYSWPVLVDRATGRLDTAAVRRELRRARGPAAWSADEVRIRLFQKARLQLRWARQELVVNAEINERVARQDAELAARARATAEHYGFDTHALRFQRDRYTFGSLSRTMLAAQHRVELDRALDIAMQRKAGG